MLAHYQNLAPWRRAADTRGGPSPRVWIDGAEVADVYRRFADVQLTREPAIEISGASGVPLMLAMAQGRDWSGHVPGPRGLPGGYPVRLAAGEIDLDLPAALTRERGDRLEPALRAGERSRGRRGRPRDLHRAAARAPGGVQPGPRRRLPCRATSMTSTARCTRCARSSNATGLTPRQRPSQHAKMRAGRARGRPAQIGEIPHAQTRTACRDRRARVTTTDRPCAGADRLRRDHAALAAGRDLARPAGQARQRNRRRISQREGRRARPQGRALDPRQRRQERGRRRGLSAARHRTRRRSRCSASSTAASTSR